MTEVVCVIHQLYRLLQVFCKSDSVKPTNGISSDVVSVSIHQHLLYSFLYCFAISPTWATDCYLERLELERYRITFWHGDLPDALLVWFVVVGVVGTGQNSSLLANLTATYRYTQPTSHSTVYSQPWSRKNDGNAVPISRFSHNGASWTFQNRRKLSGNNKDSCFTTISWLSA